MNIYLEFRKGKWNECNTVFRQDITKTGVVDRDVLYYEKLKKYPEPEYGCAEIQTKNNLLCFEK